MTDAVVISIVTGGTTVVVTLVSAYFSYRAKTVSQETHTAVNSHLDAFLKLAEKSFKAEGKLEGVAEQKATEATAQKNIEIGRAEK